MDLVMQDTVSDSLTETARYDSVSSSSNTLSGASPSRDYAETSSTKEKRRGRKGRTKSRTGCFNCKRARIKCKENRPICDYCLHRDLNCEWPDLQINHLGTLARRPVGQPETSISTNPQYSMPPVFTIQDFRLFNHFVQNAYPHHPIGDSSVWRHEIPTISSDYEDLLHAMLALSASDLASGDVQPADRQQLTSVALAHRVKAISALHNAIAAGIDDFKRGNAMLATCFALVFQSTLIDDGLVEYMTFIRGTISVGIQMGMKKMKFLFLHLFGSSGLDQIDSALSEIPLINPGVVASCCRSFDRFEHLCQSEVEREIWTNLIDIARSLRVSSRDAYLNLQKVYKCFSYTMPYDQFREFINPQNEVCRLLQAHFIALQLIMTPITKAEWAGRENTSESGNGTTGRWLIGAHSRIPAYMEQYYEWTRWVQQEVSQGRVYNGLYADEPTDGWCLY